jgi:hypothetical protein
MKQLGLSKLYNQVRFVQQDGDLGERHFNFINLIDDKFGFVGYT